MTFSINGTCGVMLSVVILNVFYAECRDIFHVMLNIVKLGVVILSVMAQSNICGYCKETLSYYIRMYLASQNLID